jgi:uncharacterized Zn finger protein (UPF0148 family)
MEGILALVIIGLIIYLLDKSDSRKRKAKIWGYERKSGATFKASHRIAHCHHCKTSLNSSHHKDCHKCGWIICPNCDRCEYACLREKEPDEDRRSTQHKDTSTAYNSSYSISTYNNSEDFLNAVLPKITALTVLSAYEMYVIKRFSQYVSSDHPLKNELIKLLDTGIGCQPLCNLISNEALRKGVGWWSTINEPYKNLSTNDDYYDEGNARGDYLNEEWEKAKSEERYNKNQRYIDRD